MLQFKQSWWDNTSGNNSSSIWHLSIFHSNVIEERSVSEGLMKGSTKQQRKSFNDVDEL